MWDSSVNRHPPQGRASLRVSLAQQRLWMFDAEQQVCFEAPVSTAVAGAGELQDSGQTPRGWHQIRALIGSHVPVNGVLVGRRFTGEIYTDELGRQQPQRDWILTRILWLSGLEPGLNRLGDRDTMRRYIYIHGTPQSEPLGVPRSHGCIRMHNQELIALFERVTPYMPLLVSEE